MPMKAKLCLFAVLGITVGVSLWLGRDLPRQLSNESQREAALEARINVAPGRIAYRQTIVEDLIAERITLAKAAAKFEELNATYSGDAMVFASFPGASEEECRCRQVIIWVKSLLGDRPYQADSVVERLGDELQKHLSQDGSGA
jgi:hypothetical protein